MQRNEWDLPNPAGVEPVVGPRLVRWLVLAVVVAVLAVAAFVVPVPSVFLYVPGPVKDVSRLVEVDGTNTYSSEGSLYLTTVNIDSRVTFAEFLEAMVNPTKAVVTEEQVTGGGSIKDLQKTQRIEMRRSKLNAQQVVFSALGLGGATGDGARVVETIEGEPADGKLKPGDLIVSIDGHDVFTTCDVGRVLDDVDVGEEIELRLRREGRAETIRLTTGPSESDPATAFLGIQMRDVDYEFDPSIEVDIETGRIAGPSAGLMFSLALYDRLTPDDLTHGLQIAGTGTIDCDGEVGAIGGVEQKVAGAELEGAEIFLSPAANFDDAQAAAGEIEVVSVGTFEDAVEYLEGLE